MRLAHARRYFDCALSTEPQFAAEVLQRIGELYVIEREAKKAGLTPDGLKDFRQEKAKPLLEALEDWLTVTRTKVLDRGPMARAIDYTLENWKALLLYLDDGRLPIDNNAAERSLRGVCVDRKNWMFLGSENGGKTAARLFSLVETCKEIGVHPREYLYDVLQRISECSDVTKLTPHGWKSHFQDEVRARRSQFLSLFFDAT